MDDEGFAGEAYEKLSPFKRKGKTYGTQFQGGSMDSLEGAE